MKNEEKLRVTTAGFWRRGVESRFRPLFTGRWSTFKLFQKSGVNCHGDNSVLGELWHARGRMSTTRIGKIGRLPRQVREELNRRLLEGEPGITLVAWLNGQAAVQPVLDRWFGGRPVTEQNLSEWRQGGYEDWQRQEEARAWVRELGEATEGLGNAGELGDRFACVLAVGLTRLAKVLLDKEGEPEQRWERLCKVSQELSRLRRDEQRAVQTRIREEQWALAKAKQEMAAAERAAAKRREKELAPFKAAQEVNYRTMLNGGGRGGREVAERMLEIEHGLEHGTLNVERLQAALKKPRKKAKNRVESDRIQPAGHGDANGEFLQKGTKGQRRGKADEDGHSNAEFGTRRAE